MRTGFLSRLDHFARGLLPLICTLSVVLLSALPLRLPMAAMVAPSLTLIAVYYWTIYRPDLLNGFFILVMLVAIGAAIVAWLCNFILSGRWIDPTGSAIGLLLTILLYPPLAALLSQVHKLVPARDADA